ncbi:MAG: hypothetical protein LC775_18570, partial [Acidobacteria bacterium]|nr:hypothetical protein [Acidobacteriota bacterium]
MSELKLNLIDREHVLHGTIHGSVADRCVAALSAEPETIGELTSALSRYNKRLDDWSPFASFHSSVHSSIASSADPPIDCRAWDAGIVVIDLTARIVAADSTYSQPQPEGEIHYHDGTKCTDIPVLYRLPDDWLFVNSVEAYQWSRERRAKERLAKAPFDARHVLYGTPLLEFLVNAIGTSVEAGLVIPAIQASASHQTGTDTFIPTVVRNFAVTDDVSMIEDDCKVADGLLGNGNGSSAGDYEAQLALATALSAIHARWLMTPREDLRGDSPRDVMLARQDFIDFELHTRSLQWSLLDEGPPCLASDSFAYRFAGFGTHEWIIYYDLVRYLLWSAAADKQLWSAVTCHPFGRSDVSTAVACAEPLLTPLASDETLHRQHSSL